MNKIKLIAETAWHHEGDFDYLRNLVRVIINSVKADVIKLHITLDLDEYMASDHSAYDYFKDKIFSIAQWTELLDELATKNIEKLFLFNDKKSIEFGMRYNPALVEIHSVCLNDIYLLDTLKSNLNPETKLVLGVGGSTLYEIENAINRLAHNKIVLMHGFQNYPTKYENINLNKIKKIMALYPFFEHGYADHTSWDEPNNILITLLGAAQGMNYIEKHLTNEFGNQRIDFQSAVSVAMFNEISEKISVLNDCLGNGNLDLNKSEREYGIIGPMKKAGLMKYDVKSGEVFNPDMIEFKRTSQVTNLNQFELIELFGKMIKTDLKKGQILTSASFIL